MKKRSISTFTPKTHLLNSSPSVLTSTQQIAVSLIMMRVAHLIARQPINPIVQYAIILNIYSKISAMNDSHRNINALFDTRLHFRLAAWFPYQADWSSVSWSSFQASCMVSIPGWLVFKAKNLCVVLCAFVN